MTNKEVIILINKAISDYEIRGEDNTDGTASWWRGVVFGIKYAKRLIEVSNG